MTPNSFTGAIAAGHELTARTAANVLADGGNAFDATIAAACMACVCEPVLASCGGGGFAMVRDARGDTGLFDFFAQTPLNKAAGPVDYFEVHADFGPATQGFHIGHGATATPGFLPGLFAMHEAHATWPMADLLAPAAAAARRGVIVTPFQAYLSRVVAPILTHTPAAALLFAQKGELATAGETFCNPGLADLFELLASQGLAAYSTGSVHTAMLKGQRRGHLRAGDFAAYRVERRTPLTFMFEGAAIHTNPPPAAGGALIAHALDQLDGAGAPAIAKALQATGRARTQAGGDLKKLIAGMGRPSYRGTTHISVIDSWSNACAMTVSNGEGNGELVEPFGFMLNNMLGEEDVNPAGGLGWANNRRLSSMMAPTLAQMPDGTLIALGSGGSNRIRSAIVQVLSGLVSRRLDVKEAVMAPRLHVENGHLDIEDMVSRTEMEALALAFPDHRRWPGTNMFFGGCHVAARTADGVFCGAGDNRRAGISLIGRARTPGA